MIAYRLFLLLLPVLSGCQYRFTNLESLPNAQRTAVSVDPITVKTQTPIRHGHLWTHLQKAILSSKKLRLSNFENARYRISVEIESAEITYSNQHALPQAPGPSHLPTEWENLPPPSKYADLNIAKTLSTNANYSGIMNVKLIESKSGNVLMNELFPLALSYSMHPADGLPEQAFLLAFESRETAFENFSEIISKSIIEKSETFL